MAVNWPGWVPRIGPRETYLWKRPPKSVRHGFTFPSRASDSCRKLLTAEVVQQTNAWSTARVLECSDRFYLFVPRKVERTTFHYIQSVLNFHSPHRVELNTSCWTFHSTHLVESRTEQIVFSSILHKLFRLPFCTRCIEFCLRHWLNVHCTLSELYSLSLCCLISRVQSLRKIALT